MFANVHFLLIILAFGLTIVSGTTGKCPLWVPLLLVTIAMLIGVR
jgi:hypothetical protein